MIIDGVLVSVSEGTGVSEAEIRSLILEEKACAKQSGRAITRMEIEPDGGELVVKVITTPPIKRIRRITGYLASTDRWNPGKLAELRDRYSSIKRIKRVEFERNGAATSVSLRVHGVVCDSVVDGPGLRDVVFVQGCPHRCPGCQNPGSWDFEGGSVVDVADIISIIPSSPLTSGVTFSGGEPFCQASPLVEIAKHAKKKGLNLWVYTGYTWEELMKLSDPAVRELLSYVDALVDGRYLQEERNISLPYRGSRNQRLIDVQMSLKTNLLFLWESQEKC